MFPRSTVRLTRRAIKNSDFLKTSFFKLDKQDCLVLVNNKRRKILVRLNFLIHCSYVSFLAYRCIQTYLDESAGTREQVLMEYFFGISLMPVLYHVNLLLRSQEFKIFSNAYPQVLREIWDELPDDDVRPMGNAFLKLLVRSSQMICFMDLLSVFVQPGSPSLLSSVVPNANELEKWKVIPFGIIQGYIWYSGWSVCLVVALHLLAYMNGVGWTCSRLVRRQFRQSADEFTLMKDAASYRKLQVVQNVAKDAISIALQGQQFLCVVLIMRSLYGALVVDGPERGRMIVGIIAHFGFLRGVFKAVAEVSENSDAVLSSWSTHGHDKWFRRFRRSCRALRVEMSGLYYVDHSMMLSMWAIILDGTVNLLLTGSVL